MRWKKIYARKLDNSILEKVFREFVKECLENNNGIEIIFINKSPKILLSLKRFVIRLFEEDPKTLHKLIKKYDKIYEAYQKYIVYQSGQTMSNPYSSILLEKKICLYIADKLLRV